MTEKAICCPQCRQALADAVDDTQRFCPNCRFPLLAVAGKYVLQEKLAEGGFGVLYLARHTALHAEARRVVKVFKQALFADDDGTMHERFLREVRVTAALSEENQHIVRIYDDFGKEPGFGHYYVMEHLEGETLDDRIKRDTPDIPDLHQVFDIFYQLCRAMRAAHQRGIIHRDLKPDNIFLIKREEIDPFVKVIDFGIAKEANAANLSKQTKGVIGTPSYMAPEQCLGHSALIDARSDIYAMGIILYEMLVGTPPFVAESATEVLSVIHAQITTNPPTMAEARPSLQVDAGLARVVSQALAKESIERFPSVEAFWNALLPYVPSSLGLAALPEPPLDDAFLAALEASQTIPAETMLAVPTNPEEAQAWLAGEAANEAPVEAPLLHEPLLPTPVPWVAAPQSDYRRATPAPLSHDQHTSHPPILVPLWRRIPTWMWASGIGLMCCGVLLGVWLPTTPENSRSVASRMARQASRKIASSMRRGTWTRASQPLPGAPAQRRTPLRPHVPTTSIQRPPARPLRVRHRRRKSPTPRRAKHRRPLSRPRALRQVTLAQRQAAAEARLKLAKSRVALAPSSGRVLALLRAHRGVLLAAKRGRTDPNVLRWQRLSLMRSATTLFQHLKPSDARKAQPIVAQTAYQLALQRYQRFVQSRVTGKTRGQLRDSTRAKGLQYRQTIQMFRRVAGIKHPRWTLCALVKSAEAASHFAHTLDKPTLYQECTDCTQTPKVIHMMIKQRFVLRLRGTATRQLARALQSLSPALQQDRCAKKGRLLQRQLKALEKP